MIFRSDSLNHHLIMSTVRSGEIRCGLLLIDIFKRNRYALNGINNLDPFQLKIGIQFLLRSPRENPADRSPGKKDLKHPKVRVHTDFQHGIPRNKPFFHSGADPQTRHRTSASLPAHPDHRGLQISRITGGIQFISDQVLWKIPAYAVQRAP